MGLILQIQPTVDQKYFFNSRKFQKAKLEFAVHQQICSIYNALGIKSNLEIIWSIWKDVHSLYANTMPFYIRDLSIRRFWYLLGREGFRVLEQIPFGFWWTTIICHPFSLWNSYTRNSWAQCWMTQYLLQVLVYQQSSMGTTERRR